MSDLFDELPLFAPTKAKRSRMEQAFWDFHAKHPEVYTTLLGLARRWKARHVRRIGIATVFETARYTLDIERDDDGLKLNNNHRAYYARLLMDNETDLRGIFALRQQRIKATIGPENGSLPPNIHIS